MIKLVPDTDPGEMVDLFEWKDKVYKVPTKTRMTLIFNFYRRAAKDPIAAEIHLLESLIGKEAVAEVLDDPEFTDEMLKQIQDAAIKHAMGAVEEDIESEGNDESGSPKSDS